MRRSIGMIFQHFNLLSSRTAFGNVALPLEIAGVGTQDIEKRVAPLLDLVGLSDKRDRYPSELVGRPKAAHRHRPRARHRAEACCSPTRRPRPSIRKPRAPSLPCFRQINKELGLTVLLITHEMEVVKAIADHVAVIDGGRIVEQGPTFDVFTGHAHETTQVLCSAVSAGMRLPEFLTSRMTELSGTRIPGRSSGSFSRARMQRNPCWRGSAAILASKSISWRVPLTRSPGRPFGMLVVSLRVPTRRKLPKHGNFSPITAWHRRWSAMSADILALLVKATGQTLYMVVVAGLVGSLFGIPLGVFLATSGKGELFPAPSVNKVLGAIVNATRSTPFIILVVAIIPFTRLIAGTSIGTSAAIVPLTIATIPFVARLVETAIREVDPGLTEAARAMGASPMQIVFKVLLAEARPGIASALTLTIVSLIGYSAMVGAVGGGGLGDLGIRYGYQRFMPDVMATVVVVLIVLVQLVQSAGDRLARRFDKRVRPR